MSKFNFDLRRIQQMLDSPSMEVPFEIVTFEQFQEWLYFMNKNEKENEGDKE